MGGLPVLRVLEISPLVRVPTTHLVAGPRVFLPTMGAKPMQTAVRDASVFLKSASGESRHAGGPFGLAREGVDTGSDPPRIRGALGNVPDCIFYTLRTSFPGSR